MRIQHGTPYGVNSHCKAVICEVNVLHTAGQTEKDVQIHTIFSKKKEEIVDSVLKYFIDPEGNSWKCRKM